MELEALEKTEISADVTALTSTSDLSWAVTGVGVHILFYILLHALSRIEFSLQSIIGGDCGGPAGGLLPAVHDGRVGHGEDRRAPPCSLWAGAL